MLLNMRQDCDAPIFDEGRGSGSGETRADVNVAGSSQTGFDAAPLDTCAPRGTSEWSKMPPSWRRRSRLSAHGFQHILSKD